MTQRACPVVLSAVSGTGKTTLARRLVSDFDRYVFSVSATTRQPRPHERDGIDYHFVGADRFGAMIEAGDLVEWAEVHGRMYGTPRAELELAAGRGDHVVLDIDVQGAMLIREAVDDAKLIFVLPPSVGALMGRLRGRGTEGPKEVARRLQSALDELAVAPAFDHVVVNDDLGRCIDSIRAIVEGAEGGGDAAARNQIERLRGAIAKTLESEYNNVAP